MPEDDAPTPPEPQEPQAQPPFDADDDAARRRLEEREARLAALRKLRERLREPDDGEQEPRAGSR